jgi:hypothetical protein
MEGYYIVLPKLINNNTLLGVFNKHHGLNYFGLDYQRGIAHGKEHSMHMRYSIIKHHGLNYFSLDYQRGIAHGKEHSMHMRYSVIKHHGLNYFGLDYQRGIAYGKEHSMHMRYSVIKHHGSTLLEGYYSCSKLQNTFAIPFIGFPINTLGSITYIFKLEGVMHSLTNMG